MLTSDAMMAIEGEEKDSKTILSRFWARNLLFLSLLSTKEIWSEKLSITWRPGENSKFKGSKEERYSLNLLAKSIKWPLTNVCCLLVSKSRETALKHELELELEFMRDHIRWLNGSLLVQSWDLLPSLRRWR